VHLKLPQTAQVGAVWKLYDIQGRLVQQVELVAGIREHVFPVSQLPGGLYFYTIQSNGSELLFKGSLMKTE
ncbi:MAG: T9SS type A sorting domain-containing protein, partial [Saprospiraceae bacterium]|nr:T9SS type A sorting domain-containing protein [Saprospiraceae bacterium]